jgi:GNAT superfamily N-acetyltransferase
MLVEDETYFVLEAGGEVVACGGWSRRDKLYSGSSEQEGRAKLLDPATDPARVRAMFVRADWTRRGLGTRILEECTAAARRDGFRAMSLVATLPGLLLYEHYGFRAGARGPITLPDGVEIECVPMDLALG